MPAQLRRAPAFAGQPLFGKRLCINPRHWLAKDVIFAHTGQQGFVFGAPATPSVDGLPQQYNSSNGSTENSPFVHSLNFRGDGSNYLIYETGGHPTVLTLVCWAARNANISGTNATVFSSSSESAGYMGLRMSTLQQAQLLSSTSTGTINGATASVNTSVNTWHQIAGWRASNTSRAAYLDGGNKGTTATSNVTGAHTRFILGGFTRNGTSQVSTAQTSGIAFPVAVARVLSDEEIARLYQEQLINPWTLFAERPRMIWLGAGAAPSIPTLSALARTNLRRPRYTWTP